MTFVKPKKRAILEKKEIKMSEFADKKFREYRKWFNEKTEETGGLILQATAARLLNTPRQNINRMIRIGKLKTYQFSDEYETYIGLNEIEEIIKNRIKAVKTSNLLMISQFEGETIHYLEMANVNEVNDNSDEEWANEWLITQPKISFREFIQKKKEKWMKAHPDVLYTPEVDEEGNEFQTYIALAKDSKGNIGYLRSKWITNPARNRNTNNKPDTTNQRHL